MNPRCTSVTKKMFAIAAAAASAPLLAYLNIKQLKYSSHGQNGTHS